MTGRRVPDLGAEALRGPGGDPMTDLSVLARSTARGLAGAMMMTGARQLTTNLGLMDEPPPETVVRRKGPRQIRDLGPGQRAAVTELVHWTYGAAGGFVYGLLPRRVRVHPATGPVYALLIWLGFELGIAPLIG